MSDKDNYPKTIIEWWETSGIKYRIQISPRPGSAHWNVTKDAKIETEQKWQRIWGIEARERPDVLGE